MTDLSTARSIAASLRTPTGDGLSAPDVADLIDELVDALDVARKARLARRSVVEFVDKTVHTPARIRAYLLAHGWTCTHEWHDSSEWGRPLRAGETAMYWEVRVLDSDRFRDYRQRVADLAETVADCGGTGELAVLAGIAAAEPKESGNV